MFTVTMATFFDWGVFKPWGELILVVTSVVFVFAIYRAASHWLSIGRVLHGWSRCGAALLGVSIVFAMCIHAAESHFYQCTSVHHQDRIHWIACAVLVVGYAVSVVISSVVARTEERAGV